MSLAILLACLAASPAFVKSDLFSENPRLEIPPHSGHLLPSEARQFRIFAYALDTVVVRVRPLRERDVRLNSNEEEGNGDEAAGNGDDEESELGSRNAGQGPMLRHFAYQKIVARPRDSSSLWTLTINLDSLSQAFGGAFLDLSVFAPPHSFLPPIRRSQCDTVWIREHLLIGKLGIFATRLDTAHAEVYAVDLVTGRPWPQVKLTARNRLGVALHRATTGPDGAATITLDTATRLQGATQNQQAWASLTGSDDASTNTLEGSIGSQSDRSSEFRLFPYLPRGVYRPGDSLVVGCVVRKGGGRIPRGQKLFWELSVPRGEGHSDSALVGPEGHLQWRQKLPEHGHTGSGSLSVSLGGATQSVGYRVELERPRQVEASLGATWVKRGQRTAVLFTPAGKWLSGRPAAYARIHLEVTIHPKLRDDSCPATYSCDPWRNATKILSQTIQIDTALDGRGQLDLVWMLPDSLQRVGRAHLVPRLTLYQGNGQTVTATAEGLWLANALGHPGLAVQRTRERATIQLAAWDSAGVPRSGDALRLRIYRDSSVLLDTNLRRSGMVLEASRFQMAAVEANRSFALLAVLCHDRSGLCVETLVPTQTSWENNRFVWGFVPSASPRPMATPHPVGDPDSAIPERQPDSLEIVLVGDAVKLTWDSPREGLALVQVMQGQRVVHRAWVAVRRGRNRWSQAADSTWDPGVTVAISQFSVRRAGEPGQLRRRAVREFCVRNQVRLMDMAFQMDSVLQTGGSQRVFVQNLSHRAGSLVLSATDVGILRLDGFQSPDPEPMLDEKEAVYATWWDGLGRAEGCYVCEQGDACDLDRFGGGSGMMGGIGSGSGSGRIGSRMAVGSGAAGRGPERVSKVRLPEPMAWTSGVLAFPAAGRAVQIPVGQYTGALQLMAVGTSGRLVGVADTTVPVRASLELQVVAPAYLSPGDTALVAVELAGTPRARVAVVFRSLRGGFAVARDTLWVQLDSLGRGVTPSQVVANAAPQDDGLEVVAIQAGFRRVGSVLLPVRSQRDIGQEVTRAQSLNGSLKLGLGRHFHAFGLESRLEVSTHGVLGLDAWARQLIHTPHGCVEQTTSGAYPQLFLAELFPGLSQAEKDSAHQHVVQAIDRLREFQTPSGLLSLWPHNVEPYPWGTLWAAGFLADARDKGFEIPVDLEAPLFNAIRDSAHMFGQPLEMVERIDWLARSKHVDSVRIDSLAKQNLSNVVRWRLAKVLARLGARERAVSQSKLASTAVESETYLNGSLGSPLRDRALILEAMVALGDARRDSLLQHVAAVTGASQWASTQQMAAVLRALSKALPAARSDADTGVEWKLDQGGWKPLVLRAGSAVKILPPATDSVFLRWRGRRAEVLAQVSRRGTKLGSDVLVDSGFGLAVACDDTTFNTPLQTAWPVRKDFACQLRVVNHTSRWLPNSALSLWLPAGWEVRNLRLESARAARSNGSDHTDYRDDRVVKYFDIGPNQTLTFEIPMRTTVVGRYQGPAAKVETLYDGSLQAAWKGPRIQVTAK